MELVLSEKCFQEFLELIHELTGITIAKNRTSMIEGRLRKRITTLKLQSYESYLNLVKESRAEQGPFIDLVTTNETYFFRTPRIWDYIEHKFLPAWHSAHPKQIFNAWSAAASSGEEAHSLGLICQTFKEKNPGFLYQILGTDISQEMVGLCQAGQYTGRSIDSFKKTRAELFAKHMRPGPAGSFQVSPEIKSRLKFHQHNLFRPLQSSNNFDLILIRNVLIYFTGSDQEKVLSHLKPRMSESGILIIGESESLHHIETPFKSIEPFIYRSEELNSSPKKAV